MRLRLTPLPEAVRSLPVGAGEKVLAGCLTDSGAVVAGTRYALYLSLPESGVKRISWERVEQADWDQETSLLTVSEVGDWGAVRPVHELALVEPARLLELIRERVTASLLLQRHVRIHGGRGVHVIARRAPHGDRAVTWVYQFDEGIDPSDPEVRRLAEIGLVRAQQEFGS